MERLSIIDRKLQTEQVKMRDSSVWKTHRELSGGARQWLYIDELASELLSETTK